MGLLALHHLVELVKSNLLVVEGYGALKSSSELNVDSTLNEVVYSLALLEKLVSVVLNILVRNVSHAVLSKLHASHLDSSSLNVSVLNLDLVSLYKLLLDKVPLELLDALSVVLLNKVLALILVVKEHNALEKLVCHVSSPTLFSQYVRTSSINL